MAVTEDKLKRLKNILTQRLTQVSELQGEKKALIKRLQDEFQCTPETAAALLEKLKSDIAADEQEIERAWQELVTKCREQGLIPPAN